MFTNVEIEVDSFMFSGRHPSLAAACTTFAYCHTRWRNRNLPTIGLTFVKRFWNQAKGSLAGENWDAAAVMARSALQSALREKGAVGRGLKGEINDLVKKGILHP
jgi:hypothetical protein